MAAGRHISCFAQSWLGCLCSWSGRQPLPAGGREHGDGSTRSCCAQVPSVPSHCKEKKCQTALARATSAVPT